MRFLRENVIPSRLGAVCEKFPFYENKQTVPSSRYRGVKSGLTRFSESKTFKVFELRWYHGLIPP